MLQAPNCRGRAFEALILNVELQDLVFALLGFVLALVQYFSTLPPFFPFGMVLTTLFYYVLEVSNLLFGVQELQLINYLMSQ